MDELRPLLVITGRQRSGTTAIRSIVRQSLNAADLGEIFHSQFEGNDRNYFNFASRAIEADKRQVAHIHDLKVFRQFLDYVYSQVKAPAVVIDVKYGALFVVRPHKSRHCLRPAIFDIFDERQAKIVHVVRKNKLMLLLSEYRALSTGEWGNRPPIPESAVRIRAPSPEHLAAEITAEIELEGAVRGFIASTPNHIELCYEEIFTADGMLERAAEVELERFLGAGVASIRSPVTKNVTNWREEIINFAEMLQYLENSPHAWMTQPLL